MLWLMSDPFVCFSICSFVCLVALLVCIIFVYRCSVVNKRCMNMKTQTLAPRSVRRWCVWWRSVVMITKLRLPAGHVTCRCASHERQSPVHCLSSHSPTTHHVRRPSARQRQSPNSTNGQLQQQQRLAYTNEFCSIREKRVVFSAQFCWSGIM